MTESTPTDRPAFQRVLCECARCHKTFTGDALHQLCGTCVSVVAQEIAEAQVGGAASAPMPSPGAIRSAIKETEDKYFGDYEMSNQQRVAVDTLVTVAQAYLDALEAETSDA